VNFLKGSVVVPVVLTLTTSRPRRSQGNDLKILSTSPLGGTKAGGTESEISGSLKNLKPEKIGV
jgi:hypothetical protein